MRRGRAFAVAGALGLAVVAACASTGLTPAEAQVRAANSPVAAPTLAPGQQATVRSCNGQKARITEPATRRGAAPAAVYVHGGSWVGGDLDTGGFLIDRIGPALAARGFVVVSLDYRLGPGAPWPDQIVDVKCAVRYLRANARRLHIDPARIGAWGHSAGGHLVALLGTAGPSAGWDIGPYGGESSAVQAVVDLAGPSDLLTMGDKGDAASVTASFISLLGRVPAAQLRAELKRDSPTTYVAPGDPPFLLIHSLNDAIVPVQQSRELDRDLGSAGVPHRLLTVRGGGHLFDGPDEKPSEAAITAAVVGFFVRTLLPPGS